MRPADGAATPQWLDEHLLLNAVAVLRHRIASDQRRASELVDVLGGYLGAALLLQRSSSIASVDHFIEWAECVVEMTRLADPQPHGLRLHVETDGEPATLDLSGLECPCTLLLSEARRAAPEPFASVVVVVRSGAAQFLIAASAGDLAGRLLSLPGARAAPHAALAGTSDIAVEFGAPPTRGASA